MNRYIKALLTKHKKKSLPQCLKNTWFDEWMSYGYITFISAFIFQGMLYANWRENVIKIALDIIIGGVFFLFLPWYLAALIAHSMNFCLNGQFLVFFIILMLETIHRKSFSPALKVSKIELKIQMQ